MTEVQRTPQQIVSRDVPVEIESYKTQLKHLQEIGHIGDGLIDFYDSVQELADQIERDAEELRLLLIEQAKSVMEELEKFRHVQDEVENLLSDYSHEGPMQEARYAILLEGLALFEVAA